jgi:hypothetical protein
VQFIFCEFTQATCWRFRDVNRCAIEAVFIGGPFGQHTTLGVTMKKQIALLIGATIAGVAFAQTPAPTVPPVQTPRAATPPAEVKPPVSVNASPKAEVKAGNAVASTAVKTDKGATVKASKTTKKPKGPKPVTTGDVKGEMKGEVKANVKADEKKADKKP